MPDEQTQGDVQPSGTTLTQSVAGGAQDSKGGNGATDWSSQIPSEIAAEKVWEPLKGKPLGEVLKGYHEAQKLIGSTLRLPKDDAKPEEWNAFYTKLGRPEKAEKYELLAPEVWDEPKVSAFKEIAFSAGLTAKQAQAVMDYIGDADQASAAEEEKTISENLVALKNDWGPNFERNIVIAQRAVKEFSGPGFIKMLDDTKLGNHPAMISFMAKIGEYLAEDGTISGDVRGVDGREEAQRKISSINSDPKHPYWNEGPGHKEAVEEMTRLSKLAYR